MKFSIPYIFGARPFGMRKAKQLSILLISLTSSTVFSQNSMYHSNINESRHASKPAFDYAQVQFVEPVYETYQTSTPRENCWTETLRPASRSFTHRRGSNEKLTGNLMGGVIGGVIGNAVGKGGDNKKIGAVVGSIIGMSVANNMQNRSESQFTPQKEQIANQRSVQRCEVREELRQERRVVSYKVGYRYQGINYVSNMPRAPSGDSLRVVVNVTPADQN